MKKTLITFTIATLLQNLIFFIFLSISGLYGIIIGSFVPSFYIYSTRFGILASGERVNPHFNAFSPIVILITLFFWLIIYLLFKLEDFLKKKKEVAKKYKWLYFLVKVGTIILITSAQIFSIIIALLVYGLAKS